MKTYKRRLLVEYADLKVKIVRLEDYLENIKKPDYKDKTYIKYDAMEEQLNVMKDYFNILEQRILMEMEEK